MSTNQRASKKAGELIHNAFESLLQVNADLERLQDLLGLGMDARHLLTPHSQTTWKFLAPQEQKFRENWKKFVSATEAAESSANHPQQTAVEPTEPTSTAPLPAIAAQTTEEPVAVTQTEVRDSFGWFGDFILTNPCQSAPEPSADPPTQGPALCTSAAPIPVTVKEETEHSDHLPPSGSINNPMEIEDSDGDEIVVQASVTTPKRKKTGMCMSKAA